MTKSTQFWGLRHDGDFIVLPDCGTYCAVTQRSYSVALSWDLIILDVHYPGYEYEVSGKGVGVAGPTLVILSHSAIELAWYPGRATL